jgi:hypothetical protein
MPHSDFWAEDPTRVDRFIDMWNKGLTVDEIARELGTSRGSISGKRQRLDLPRRSNILVQNWRATPEKIAGAKNLRRLGLSLNAIAERCMG